MEEFNKLNILQKRKMAIEDLVKYYADYRIYSVRNQNTCIRIYLLKLVKED